MAFHDELNWNLNLNEAMAHTVQIQDFNGGHCQRMEVVSQFHFHMGAKAYSYHELKH